MGITENNRKTVKAIAVILAMLLCLGGTALADAEGPLFKAKSI